MAAAVEEARRAGPALKLSQVRRAQQDRAANCFAALIVGNQFYLGLAIRRRQARADGVVRSVEVVAEALHRGDSRNGDQGGNEAVFNRGRALLVTAQLGEELHDRFLSVEGYPT